MEHLVITTGFSQSGWSRGLAALAHEQFAVGVDEILESWRTQALGEAEADASTSLPLEHLAAWSSTLDPGRAALLNDERDLWLLDQWAEHCPQARFLLFYTDPESALIAALQAGADPSEFLDGWRTAAQRLVRFQRRHRQRSLLLDAEAARHDPRAMVEAARRIGLMLRFDEAFQPADEDPVFERLVARPWLAREPDLALLQAELEAHAYPLGERTAVAEPDVDQLLELYRREQAFRRRLTAERDEQARLAEEKTNEAKGQSQLAAERGAELARMQEQLSTLEATHKETIEENELLLLQLHQVQEALESQFLQGKEQLEALTAEKTALTNEREALTKERAALSTARDEQSKLAAERGAELARMQEQLSTLEATHKETMEKNELLLLQLHQAHEALESQLLQGKEQLEALTAEKTALTNEREALTKERAALSTARDEQSKLAAERGAELARMQEQLSTLEATHKETIEENELLLLRLHQVQEELEQYFLKYQELKGLQDESGTTLASGSTGSADKPAPKPQAPDRRRSKRPPALKSRGLFGKNRKERRRLERYVAIIRESGLFDEAWYLSQYPDVVAAGYDAIEHYVCHGREENRHPAPWFDTAFYLEHNPDVANSIMNPLVHYHQFGQAERRPTRRGY